MRFLYVILLIALFVPRVGHGQPRGIPERITGYAGYQFGMSLDQAMTVRCSYASDALRLFQRRLYYCLERNEDFFGEPGTIKVLFGGTDKTITAIRITFDRFEPEERTDGACARTAEVRRTYAARPRSVRGLRPPSNGPPFTARLLPRCRIACWRQTRAGETAATLAGLHAENTALRQRVAELERLVGPLKRRLWPGA
jgi:hypothetical protein